MKKDAKERFLEKLHTELQQFKDFMMEADKETIFSESYKIDTYINLYEILVEKADSLTDTVLSILAVYDAGILAFLYQEWLKKEDGYYTELKEYVESELEKTAEVQIYEKTA